MERRIEIPQPVWKPGKGKPAPEVYAAVDGALARSDAENLRPSTGGRESVTETDRIDF